MKKGILKKFKPIIKLLTRRINNFDRILVDFNYSRRYFSYGMRKCVVNSLYCHASPGTIETVIESLEKKLSTNQSCNKLLNLGGGSGQVSNVFRKIGFDVYNVDIELDSTNDRNVKFDLNDSIDLPFENNSFDVVVAQEIIEHIENPWQLFRRAKKLLKKDGILIVSTPNISSRISKVRFLLTSYFQWFTSDCWEYHINPLPFWEVEMIAKKNKFKLLGLKGSGDYFINKGNTSKKKILSKNEVLIFVFKKL